MSSKVISADMLDGSRKLAEAFQVKEGEEILIMADNKTEPLLIEVISDAIVEKRALVTTIIGRHSPMYSGSPFRRRKEFTNCMRNALKTCDGFIDVSHCRLIYSFGEWYEYPTRQVMLMIPTTEFLASEAARFPWQVMIEIAKKAHQILRPAHGKTMSVTDPLGTDIKFKLDYNTVFPHPDWMRMDRPGAYSLFPGCPAGVPAITMYALEAEGTIVWEYQELFAHKLQVPIKVTVEKGWVTKVEGGYEAKELERTFKEYANANHVSEFGFGLNPKIPLTNNTWFTGHRAGCIFNALADSWGLGGRIKSPLWENHGLIVKPTVFVGDRLLIDNGNLTILEDPEVVKLTSKLGYDPDKWLRTEPLYRNWEWVYGM